ncbi:hypothetical protein QYF36_010937 [Acer negundo]|nr:hypothetical protein QYF36_010937 [Acer negundo]
MEGLRWQELDKILFFFPADLPFSTQLSVIGLSEGLITFTRIFSPEAACEVIEAERHSHVFYEAESDIWMVMASLKILKVEEKLSKGWGGENAYHVGGYRYLLVDGDRNISRASPPGKVTTLTKESLLAMSKLREEVDLEKGRAKWDNAGLEKDLEVCIRAKNNAWVIARITRGKELYMVLEKANETLLYASDAFEKFSSRYCNGAFSLD